MGPDRARKDERDLGYRDPPIIVDNPDKLTLGFRPFRLAQALWFALSMYAVLSLWRGWDAGISPPVYTL